MLPLITENDSMQAYSEIFSDLNVWRKNMIHYLKEENPEINSAILEAVQKTNLDPKALSLGAYMTYRLLEIAYESQENLLNT